jgi:DNA-binding response OmpR family regulator
MRILIVEDDPDIGSAIQQVLTHESHVVDWVQDGLEAWEFLTTGIVRYELAILDWMVPGLSGIELCQRLQGLRSPVRVLILTAKDGMEDRVNGLDAGADDYLVKPFRFQELLARIRSIQRRTLVQIPAENRQLHALILNYPLLTIYHQLHPDIQTTLQSKDLQLLEYFMNHADAVLTHDGLATALWPNENPPTTNAIAVRIKILRQKLTEIGFSGAIASLYGLGYRFNSSAVRH